MYFLETGAMSQWLARLTCNQWIPIIGKQTVPS